MTFASARYLRNKRYNLFISAHVLTLLAILAACWVHRPQLQGWIIAGLLLYAIDRLWRLARIVKYLTVAKLPKETTRAWVEVLAADTIRLTIKTKQHWVPGQHVYFHAPAISLGGVRSYLSLFRRLTFIFQHPFTVSSVSQYGHGAVSEQELIVRVQKGITLQLYQLAKRDVETQRTIIDAWTEGPYGSLLRFGEEFQTLLLVAGGAGISFTVSRACFSVLRY